MKKLVGMVLCVLFLAQFAGAITTYSWSSEDLSGNGFSAGWIVWLFSGDSDLPTAIYADGSTDDMDDNWLGASFQNTLVDAGKSGITWDGPSFQVYTAPDSGDVLAGDYVFTVLFDTAGAITPGVTQWTILDSVGAAAGNPLLTVDNQSPSASLTATGGGNGWFLVVPEPTTMSLLGLGLLTAAAGYRKLRK